MADVTEHFRGSGFKVFAGMIEKDPKVRVWAIPAPTGGSRAFCDRMNSWAQGEGQPGLGLHLLARGRGGRRGTGRQEHRAGARERDPEADGPQGRRRGVLRRRQSGQLLQVRRRSRATRSAQELKLVDENRFAFAWIVDFPFYEWNEDEKKIDFSHNPFSMPKGGREALEAAEKEGRDAILALKANQYDIVCNGYEIASGSVRNHMPETMVKAFEITGLGREEVEAALRRALPRVPVRRAAARRHGGRHRAHGDAAHGLARTCARWRCSR